MINRSDDKIIEWPGEPQLEKNVVIAQFEAAQYEGKPIKHVIFDFGNVLLYWDPRAVFMGRYDEETIVQFLDNEVSGFFDANDMLDEGAQWETAISWMKDTHGEQWADMFAYYLYNFEDSLTGVVPGARVLIEDLRALSIGVWGLSNWDKMLSGYAQIYCPFLKRLDGKLMSGFFGMRKPNEKFYRRILTEFGIKAEEALFIDDKASNVVGANKVGIRAVRFSDMRTLRQTLIDAGLALPALKHVE